MMRGTQRHALHSLNINSLLPKIDEIRYIAKFRNVTAIGLSETKLDNTNPKEEWVWLVLLKTMFHIIGNLIFALIQRIFL